MPIIEVDHVSKSFPARRGMRDLRGRGGLGDWLRGRKAETITALQDISISVEPGESLGIIGRNGSGKSTLLSLIAGVSLPTTGRVAVHGRVASLLELGAGFHPMLTGRENVYLNAGLLGMRHAQVDEVFESIVTYSGIGDFIDQPVDTYSSGMYVRIGFAVAVHTNPDVFLVDEVLSVGDEEFQRKCRHTIGELREQKKTIVFVSHDLGIVNTLCERVVLLDKGRMLHRDTVQKTISFYLRQVGRERGVHTFRSGALEAIQCEGRVSLFRDQQELTAPDGLVMHLHSLGQIHRSTAAEWEVSEATEHGCTAAGHMSRLPLRLIWTLRLDQGRLHWDAAMEVLREVTLESADLCGFWPAHYTRWHYGEVSGWFPEIRPSDLSWNMVAFPSKAQFGSEDVRLAAIEGEEDSALQPVIASFEPCLPQFSMYWANSEYSGYSRIMMISARFGEQEQRFAPGRYALFSMTLDATLARESMRQEVRACREAFRKRLHAERSLDSGPCTAFFEEGHIRLAWKGEEFTSYLHVYGSMLIQQLWNDSQNLHWTSIESDGRVLRSSGESRRFPFRQHWTLECLDDGFGWRIELEALEPLEVQEYHATAVLAPDYERWQTDFESGGYPPFERGKDTWVHLNKSYAPGKRITALSSDRPSVTLESTADELPFRMTAINTKYDENARVLQALRTAESGRLHFPAGRHLYFAGRIRISPPQPREA